MTTIARVLSFAFPASQAELEALKVIATFCGVGLVVYLCCWQRTAWISASGFSDRGCKLSSCAGYATCPFKGLHPLGMVLANVFARTCEDAPAAPNRLIWSVRNETPASF